MLQHLCERQPMQGCSRGHFYQENLFKIAFYPLMNLIQPLGSPAICRQVILATYHDEWLCMRFAVHSRAFSIAGV